MLGVSRDDGGLNAVHFLVYIFTISPKSPTPNYKFHKNHLCIILTHSLTPLFFCHAATFSNGRQSFFSGPGAGHGSGNYFTLILMQA